MLELIGAILDFVVIVFIIVRLYLLERKFNKMEEKER